MALKHATKLMALYEKQHRALQKSKGKGQQKVTVEHVHVEAGGQAIVGNVEAGGRTSERQATPAPEAQGPEAIDNAPEPPVDLASRSRRKARSGSRSAVMSGGHLRVTPGRCAPARAAGQRPEKAPLARRRRSQESAAAACMAGRKGPAPRWAIRMPSSTGSSRRKAEPSTAMCKGR
jgi:hypothetical protein